MKEIEYLEKYVPKDKLDVALKRLENGEPVQYIVGNVDFYGRLFDVNPSVLIPRFETEQLIEKTLKYLPKNINSILDLGTGSGCIAITLKKELPHAQVTAYDISNEALEVARGNAVKNDAEINFVNQTMEKIDGLYDVIISNPPYIDNDEEIQKVVFDNEPHIALYAENHGLYFYEIILSQASSCLNKGGLIAFEIGQTQGEDIKRLGQKYLPEFTCIIEEDYQGLDRFVFFKEGEFDK